MFHPKNMYASRVQIGDDSVSFRCRGRSSPLAHRPMGQKCSGYPHFLYPPGPFYALRVNGAKMFRVCTLYSATRNVFSPSSFRGAVAGIPPRMFGRAARWAGTASSTVTADTSRFTPTNREGRKTSECAHFIQPPGRFWPQRVLRCGTKGGA
jgi:hypothetical protein